MLLISKIVRGKNIKKIIKYANKYSTIFSVFHIPSPSPKSPEEKRIVKMKKKLASPINTKTVNMLKATLYIMTNRFIPISGTLLELNVFFINDKIITPLTPQIVKISAKRPRKSRPMPNVKFSTPTPITSHFINPIKNINNL